MLQVAARAICDRPADNPGQRDSRTRQMVHGIIGFAPRDGLEYMLSVMAVGHFNLLLDSMFDVFQGQMDSVKGRTKSTIVALDRAMLGYVKELRTCARRPVAKDALQETREAPVMKQPREAASEKHGDTVVVTPEASLAAAEVTATATSGDQPVAAAVRGDMRPAAAVIAPMRVTDAQSGQPQAGQPQAGQPLAGQPLADQPQAGQPLAGQPLAGQPLAGQPLANAAGQPQARQVTSGSPPAAVAEPPSGDSASPPGLPVDATTQEHIAAFQDAFRAMEEALAEARALDPAPLEAVGASGD
jgi:hypothetical protein